MLSRVGMLWPSPMHWLIELSFLWILIGVVANCEGVKEFMICCAPCFYKRGLLICGAEPLLEGPGTAEIKFLFWIGVFETLAFAATIGFQSILLL